MTDWIEITNEPLSVEKIAAFVTDPAAGGIDLFMGMTRAEKSPAGTELRSLDYEAYVEMSRKQLEGLAARAREQWPVVKLAILHRIGNVAVGEASVIIGVSAPHRKESFEACRFLIDELKKDVAIWKKEIWSDGPQTWVNAVDIK